MPHFRSRRTGVDLREVFGTNQPGTPDEQVSVMMTRQEATLLIQGAIKGNVIYGSAASIEGQETIRLAERFCKELGLKLEGA